MLDSIDIKYFKLAVGIENIGKETNVDITARCPVCGDSRHSKNKKRLHLYIKNNVTNVNCFNGDCPAQNKTVYSFLKDFFPSLLDQYKRENFSNTVQRLAKGETEDVFIHLKQKRKHEDSNIVKHDLSQYMSDISSVSKAIDYVKNRGYQYNENDYGRWYFGYQDLQIGDTLYKITNSIVIPLYINNEMYGFYSRSILDKTFCTYMNDANIGYKIWNWFNINRNEPVYIFEGIFDAISSGLTNVIALLGARLPDDRLAELKYPVFVLDNDKTGLNNSLKYAKKGHKVYIQPNDIIQKDMNDILLRNPGLNIRKLIKDNIFQGISAEVRIKQRL